ncbi:MAG TPA: hypothetical protein VGR53_09220 [Nitrososphaerales archaeon]|nr:hypothetical protein [Nitrososphaerales archaeon]
MTSSILESMWRVNDAAPHISDWNDEYVQVVSGGLLGDGCMVLRERMVTPSYHENHGWRQRDYVIWKCRILGASMGEYTTFDKRTCRFYARSTLWITDQRNHGLYSVFYPTGKKIVSPEVLDHVGDLGLTVLWLDDGSTKLHDGNGKLSLQSFSPPENRMIMSWLRDRYEINSVLSTENEIFLNSRELPKLLSVVYPIFQRYGLPECMRYKMGSLDPKNSESIEAAKEKRREHDMTNYWRIMSDSSRRKKRRERMKKGARRRLEDPKYREKYNDYHRVYARVWRARHAKESNPA